MRLRSSYRRSPDGTERRPDIDSQGLLPLTRRIPEEASRCTHIDVKVEPAALQHHRGLRAHVGVRVVRPCAFQLRQRRLEATPARSERGLSQKADRLAAIEHCAKV